MSELAITALRFGLLALLWIFVFSVITSQGRSLQIARPARLTRKKKDETASSVSTDTPPPPTRALATQLAITEGPLAGRTIQLGGQPLLIGRAQDAGLVLEDDYASGRHARLFPQGSRWFLEDLGSTNGTFVQGNQLTRTMAIDPGVPVRIGKTVMELKA
ncbi:FHA domain-containing protein FhaB/FipA [Enteractinococcus coprophilus]|uniref:PSer/pThr/pTyr-binding forkhead associated (FHA) protein n=1 Tax=Enteractinococcus coprophilus TaxID=1027633 RepID=A0A543APC6_9MICC|nr:FHA domain-containing protein [Enteractinococcus coprophilus]TQL74441.1 pSer/pThr/pTyr-binding forkhead associated (FHA) protein [Enteractinococcus coprophilus]